MGMMKYWRAVSKNLEIRREVCPLSVKILNQSITQRAEEGQGFLGWLALGRGFSNCFIQPRRSAPRSENRKHGNMERQVIPEAITAGVFKHVTSSIKPPHGEVTWSQHLKLTSLRPDPSDHRPIACTALLPSGDHFTLTWTTHRRECVTQPSSIQAPGKFVLSIQQQLWYCI